MEEHRKEDEDYADVINQSSVVEDYTHADTEHRESELDTSALNRGITGDEDYTKLKSMGVGYESVRYSRIHDNLAIRILSENTQDHQQEEVRKTEITFTVIYLLQIVV